MDIIVTTPKTEIENSAKEADNCKKRNGGFYFRRFPLNHSPKIKIKDKVFYCEDGYIRGFCEVSHIEKMKKNTCSTTSLKYPEGIYLMMDSTTWKWITPIPMKGFQGYRYFKDINFDIIGGWKDNKPII